MSQIGSDTNRSRASLSRRGQVITAGLYGLWVSSSMRQKAVLCGSLPGRSEPGASALQVRAVASAAAIIASSLTRSAPRGNSTQAIRGPARVDLAGPLPYIAASAQPGQIPLERVP